MLSRIEPLNPENRASKKLQKALRDEGFQLVPVAPAAAAAETTSDDDSDYYLSEAEECGKGCMYHAKIVHVKATPKRKAYDRHYPTPCEKHKRRRRKSTSRKKN